MNYDLILQNDNVDYGITPGGNKIVFIKVGLGGDFIGYESKYLKIALRLKERYGCSVIVSSNPNDEKKHIGTDKKIIEDFIKDNRISSPELFFFGHSNGGIKGLELANSGMEFKRMILVNMPLMINLHKTRSYVLAARKTDIIAVYGEKDPSFPYVPFLDGKFGNVNVITVKNADHNFKGLINEFIGLSDMLFSGV